LAPIQSVLCVAQWEISTLLPLACLMYTFEQSWNAPLLEAFRRWRAASATLVPGCFVLDMDGLRG